MSDIINIKDFINVDLRVGTVVKAETFPEARKPALKVWVDFGEEIGTLKTSAQITKHYTVETLIGKQVMGCVNLGTRQIGPLTSQFLLTGFSDENGDIILAQPGEAVPNGSKLH
tara:strand:+ start:548 stop:889 length:342 start_codon:yes stop_codon:yes gene_type:complete